ncbi:DUF4055 domain-containing protein [Klebsiella pneumoniae]|uniref:DUF4055 domain-containing protein n=1 Tax=Klebsiella pneumoniae TaxID=573 RepID=UPI0022340B82|nr:DUF4055 domain-containing protein [Klebsiella pneumoniae]
MLRRNQTPAKEAMDSKRDYSVQLGARLIEQNGAVKTATQSSGEQTASTSVLGICVSNVSEAYTLALGWCARYLGIKGEEYRYSINQEFIAKVAESGMVTAIVNARSTVRFATRIWSELCRGLT